LREETLRPGGDDAGWQEIASRLKAASQPGVQLGFMDNPREPKDLPC
jgi:hypothetical protein